MIYYCGILREVDWNKIGGMIALGKARIEKMTSK